MKVNTLQQEEKETERKPSQLHLQSQTLSLISINQCFFDAGSGEAKEERCADGPCTDKKEGLVKDVKAGGSPSCSDHEMVEFRILNGGSSAINRITILDFRRANFGLFKDLLGGISWVRSLEGMGSKSAGRYLSITSSMLRSGASP